MTAPRIESLTELLAHPVRGLPRLPRVSASVSLFFVVEGGSFGGRRWHRGDLLACAPATAEPQGPVVLEARGLGRPRLGTSRHGELFGDGGEACSPRRWRVAGQVVAVLRSAGSLGGEAGEASDAPSGWRAIELVDGGASAVGDIPLRPGAAPVRGGRRAPVLHVVPEPARPRAPAPVAECRAPGQLSLFEGVARGAGGAARAA